MPEITIPINVFCNHCQEELDARTRNDGHLEVLPCDNCLDSEKDEAFRDGWHEGHDEGYDAALSEKD